MRTSRRINILLVAIGISVLLLLIKEAVSPFLMQNTTYGMNALINKGEVNNLFIGSSTFKQGLDADILDKELGDDWYLLAYNGNQPIVEAFELEYLLSHGVKINNLYIDMYAYTAADQPKLSDEKMLMELPPGDKFRLFKLLCSDYTLKDIWRFFVTANNDIIITWPISNKLVNAQFYKGSSRANSDGSNDADLGVIEVPSGMDEINGSQCEAIYKIIKLAKTNDISLVFIETPKYITILEDETYINLMNLYSDLLSDQGVSFIRESETVDDMSADSFADLIHLSSNGRKQYTTELTGMIKVH